jgi:hypothetical protein
MLSQLLSKRAPWLCGLCAAAVLLIWISFILIARLSAMRRLMPRGIAFLRFVFSGLIVLPVVAWRARALLAGLGPDTRTALLRGAALTFTAGVGYCLLAHSGFLFAPAAHAAVLMPGSLPLWTTLFALLPGERAVSPAQRWRARGAV